MNMSFSLEMEGLQIAENHTTEQAKKVLWLSMNKMQQLAKRFAPVDTGLLRRSITLQPIQQGAIEYLLADGVKYGEDVEYGTTPHFIPVDNLKGWSRRVLGDETLAYAVAKSIAVKGTTAHPFFRPSLLEVRTVWLEKYWAQVFASYLLLGLIKVYKEV